MNIKSVFSQIIEKNVDSKIIYKDKNVTAFHDIKPLAPVHILVVSNELIKSTNDISEKNKDILGHMLYSAIILAKKFKINKTGYRMIINCNEHGGQEIFHLHLHLLGGKKLGKMTS
ncbi:MAG: histidine triad nucleotide-binding protein [Buchnera aphidicola (Kaburagia rhusicola rhusicola)]